MRRTTRRRAGFHRSAHPPRRSVELSPYPYCEQGQGRAGGERAAGAVRLILPPPAQRRPLPTAAPVPTCLECACASSRPAEGRGPSPRRAAPTAPRLNAAARRFPQPPPGPRHPAPIPPPPFPCGPRPIRRAAPRRPPKWKLAHSSM